MANGIAWVANDWGNRGIVLQVSPKMSWKTSSRPYSHILIIVYERMYLKFFVNAMCQLILWSIITSYFAFLHLKFCTLPRILCPRRLPLAPTLYHCNGQTTSSTDRYKYYIRFVIPIAQLGAVDVYNAVDVTPIELYKAIILKISSNDYRLVVQQLQQLICLWKRNLIKNKAFIDARSN